jgi:uncharacterized protein
MNVALRFAAPHFGLVKPIRRLFAAGLLLILLALTSQAVHAQGHYPQRTDRYVNDYAHLLTSADAASLQEICSNLLRTKGIELVVVSIGSTNDYDTSDQAIEPFATHLFNTWGIGDRQRNDGVLLLVAAKDRKVRIEVGSGYGDRYNATMQGVIDQNILPRFRRDDYSQGIVDGARGIAAVLSASQSAGSSSSPAAHAPVPNTSAAALPASAPSSPVSPLALLGGGAAALGAATFGARYYVLNRPRRCPHCQAQMTRLNELASEQYLDAGQKVEKSLNSVNYDVWQCPQCQEPVLYAHNRWFAGVQNCPGCRYRTLRVQEQTMVSATYSTTGIKEINRDCQHCSYHDTDTVTLPMLTYSDSSSSSSSSSSDSSGGGSSSGDGASGSW